jgi:hypothetical protein
MWPLKRGAAAGLVNNQSRETADASLHAASGGFPIACENIYRAAAPVVRDMVAHRDQWEAGCLRGGQQSSTARLCIPAQRFRLGEGGPIAFERNHDIKHF